MKPIFLSLILFVTVVHAKPQERPFEVYPANTPNTGILFVDQEKDNRSGHGGITLTECSNGDILAFYSETWAETFNGHSVAVWSQYRRSTDGGHTWGDPVVFEPSKQMWDGREVFSGLVFSVLTAPNGTLVATVVRYANAWWEKQLAPVYYLSHDHGETWEEPHTFDDSATVDDISMTMSTHFVLYASKDGINWDEGTVLMSRRQTPGGGDYYSDNEIIGKYNSDTPERLLILVDISYRGACTNMHCYWVGASPGALGFLNGHGE